MYVGPYIVKLLMRNRKCRFALKLGALDDVARDVLDFLKTNLHPQDFMKEILCWRC